jgi:uncharacterized protein
VTKSPIDDSPGGALIDIIAQPRASRTEIAGIHDGSLRIRVAAPPVDGAANAELIAFVSKAAGVRKGDVSMLSGTAGRRKRMLVRGVSRVALIAALGLDAE